MQVLYTLIYLHLLPFIVLRLLWRAQKAPAYARRINERFARVPQRKDAAPLIWVHAVSVGEVIAAIPLVKQLQSQYPEHKICITTTTPTGSDRVKAAFADSVLHYYLPYDVPSLCAVFIRAIKPEALIIMETELWPNLLQVCSDQKIPVILANGRMSERSARGYRRFSALTRPMLQRLSFIAAQSEQDAQRFIALGADKSKVLVTGSIKFDIQLTDVVEQRLVELKQQLQWHDKKRACVVFASTHPSEDEQILPMVKKLSQQYPQLLAFIVPRHPERFPVVADLAKQHGLHTVRVSEQQAIGDATQLLLGDTMGDMLAFYGLADVAFIGGSLIKHGGHNMLEAAVWRLPILSGQHVFNFQSVADNLQQAGALQLLADIDGLEKVLADYLSGKEGFAGMGDKAADVLEENQGGLEYLLQSLEPYLSAEQ